MIERRWYNDSGTYDEKTYGNQWVVLVIYRQTDTDSHIGNGVDSMHVGRSCEAGK